MRNEQIKKITFTGIIIALIIILSFTQLGYIQFLPGVSITIIHIPVLIGSIILGKKYGIVLGLIFGLSSIILAFINLSTNAPFTNPIVSVIPRIIFGFFISPLYNLIKKIIKNDIISTVVSLCLSTLLHTIIVLIPLFIVWKNGFYFGVEEYVAKNGDGSGMNLFSFIFAILSANGIIEILLAGIVGTPIVKIMKIILKNNEVK